MDKQVNNNREDRDRSQITEIYKAYPQMSDKISDRRQSANSYFLTINTIIVSLISYMSFGGAVKNYHPFYCLISIAGLVICYSWYRLIRSYKDLNSGKFTAMNLLGD